LRFLVALVVAAIALGSQSWPSQPPPPLAGFSFSPLASMQAGRDPAADLAQLLDTTEPDLVRLPIYWELVQPSRNTLDFESVDLLIAVVERHNAGSSVQTRVVLTVGARNFFFPELHAPTWAGERTQPVLGDAQEDASYHAYFDASIARYRSLPTLYAWQVENEPFDKVLNEYTVDDRVADAQIAWEVDEVHRLDAGHQVAVTSYSAFHPVLDMIQRYAPLLLPVVGGGSGHPTEAMSAGDVFGLDVYVDGPSVPYRDVTSIALRSEWKAQALSFWADRAHADGKQMWLAEMQAQPWGEAETFTPSDLVTSAVDFRQAPLDVVLLWGVDTWLDDPAWMAAGVRSLEILRSP
jgi:hypothetical protein